MARKTSEKVNRSSWMMWAFWAAGVSLLLVEVKAGMEYVEGGLRQNFANLLGYLPAMGMVTLNVAEQSVWHWSGLELTLRMVPMGVIGWMLVAVGLAMKEKAEMRAKRGARG